MCIENDNNYTETVLIRQKIYDKLAKQVVIKALENSKIALHNHSFAFKKSQWQHIMDDFFHVAFESNRFLELNMKLCIFFCFLV